MAETQPLHLEFRPKTLDEFIGNPYAIKKIKSILSKPKNQRPRVFLLCGPTGCGKTSLANILTKEYGCNEKSNYWQINSANNRGINTAREIIEMIKYAPLDGGETTAILIDEVHKTTKDFQNAMLKPLEDTPGHVVFFLCTTEPEKLLVTVRNRCTKIEVQRLNAREFKRLIDWILEECKSRPLHKRVQDELYYTTDGCPRHALIILDSILDIESIEDQLSIIKKEPEWEAKEILNLCQAILKVMPWRKITTIINGIEKSNSEPEEVRRSIYNILGDWLLKDGDPRVALAMESFEKNLYDTGKSGLIKACYMAITDLTTS